MVFSQYAKIVRTKNLFLLAAITGMVIFFSCKKAIQQQEQNIIVNAITTGHWYVELYKQDSTDVTGNFLGYDFQFYTNGNVDGILNTVTKATGTWGSDAVNYTITAAFPVAAGDTLKRLNYTWKITDSYLDYVEAKNSTGSSNNILHLRKR